ncbi:MAG TPA: hypothetical protein GXZ91_04345 [Christensenellaceae bacterium]|jgi:hypothetical protein|nr:hypothetical protein [Christensenellaceae bacterium]
MKRTVSIFMIIMLLVTSVSFAEEIDYASLSAEKLHKIINLARNELVIRESVAAKDVYLIDEENLKIYLTGNQEIDWMGYLALGVVVINNTDKTITVGIKNSSINGWEVDNIFWAQVSANKKKKDELSFKIEDADISAIEEIVEIEIAFYYYRDADDWNTRVETEPVTIHLNVE